MLVIIFLTYAARGSKLKPSSPTIPHQAWPARPPGGLTLWMLSPPKPQSHRTMSNCTSGLFDLVLVSSWSKRAWVGENMGPTCLYKCWGSRAWPMPPACLSQVDHIQAWLSKASPCPQGPQYHLEWEDSDPDVWVQPDTTAQAKVGLLRGPGPHISKASGLR